MVFLGRVAVGLLLTVAVMPVAAQPGLPVADREGAEAIEPVRVYTNADLERFGPPEAAADPAAADEDPGWEFVTEFLAREYERLDAERSFDLERRRAALEEETASRRRSRPGYYRPYLGHPFAHGKRHARKHRAPRATATSPGGRIVPLHARPSLTQRQWANATRRSGADAFPSRARRTD
jgi:hypothetical protein